MGCPYTRTVNETDSDASRWPVLIPTLLGTTTVPRKKSVYCPRSGARLRDQEMSTVTSSVDEAPSLFAAVRVTV